MTMKKIILFSSVLFLSTPPAQAELDFKVCQKSYSVSGNVHTRIISPALQVGEAQMTITDTAGTKIFEQTGGIIGKVNFLDQSKGTTNLDHYLVFNEGSVIQTHGDQGQIIGACEDGRPKTHLMIHTFAATSQVFKGAYVPSDNGLMAEGCLEMQPGGKNDFTLSGTICLAQ